MDNKPAVVPPTYPLVDVTIDPQFAAISQFLGMLEESERKRTVKRSYSVNIPRDLDDGIDRIVHDTRCGYDHNLAVFILHAVWLLANAYNELGYPDVNIGAELVHEKRVREDAEQARKRNAYIDALHQYDDEMNLARRNGDWQSIDAHLNIVESYISNAPTAAARQRVLGASASSFSLQQAVIFLDERSRDDPDIPDVVRERVARWRAYLEDVSLEKYHISLA
ncbi:hypothetical protein LCGC14_0310990 [marine sediment metagenome]|uniref:Uncharacterized protein n=1 Tax=marine sediment metagenome TaxID=412755 RepID=A0A0F9W9F6_9ZZZZ